MNIISLLSDPHLAMASGKRIFSASESGALLSCIESAEAIGALHAETEARLNESEEAARLKGYEEGKSQGFEAAKEDLSKRLINLNARARSIDAEHRQNSLDLALEIVTKVLGNIAPEKTLAALAHKASMECQPDQQLSLCVNTALVNDVSASLQEIEQPLDRISPIVNVVGDDTLSTEQCVLKSNLGSINASLETQLAAIKQALQVEADG